MIQIDKYFSCINKHSTSPFHVVVHDLYNNFHIYSSNENKINFSSHVHLIKILFKIYISNISY